MKSSAQRIRILREKVEKLELQIELMQHFISSEEMEQVKSKVEKLFNTPQREDSIGEEMIQSRLDRY